MTPPGLKKPISKDGLNSRLSPDGTEDIVARAEGVGVGVTVGTSVGSGVCVGNGVFVGIGVRVDVGIGVGNGVKVGFGVTTNSPADVGMILT